MPFQCGAPVQVIASRLVYGPNSSTSICAGVRPRPVTLMRSKIRPPGRTTWLDTIVVTAGAARVNVVSETSPQAVDAPACAVVAAIDSR